MSIYIITIRDTENGVDIKHTEVSEPGEVNAPAVVLGAAMVDNAYQYLQRHAQRVDVAQSKSTMH